MRRACTFILALLGLTLLYMSGQYHRPLQVERASKLNYAAHPESNSPLMAFTLIAMGGIRGIVADIMWLRASRLKDEGKYFELVQLADWITKLEPRLPEVWAFHGWNHSYNVSVTFEEAEERWRWVQNGFKLLRDKGLQYNPRDPNLHWELGWIFQHKIGMDFDTQHHFYKLQWFDEMSKVIPTGFIDYKATGSNAPNWQVLSTDYKMEKETMRELDEKYGPIDWRSPAAQSIYWAFRGQKFAKGFAKKKLASMLFQSMAMTMKRGKPVRLPDRVMERPNLDVIPKILKAYEAALKEHTTYAHIKNRPRQFYATVHRHARKLQPQRGSEKDV